MPKLTFARFGRLPKDPLLRLLLVNGALGVVISFIFLAGVLAANVGNLRVLIANADDPVLPLIMLILSLIITLGSVVMGSAIMMLREPAEPKKPSGGHKSRLGGGFWGGGQPAMVPVRVRPQQRP